MLRKNNVPGALAGLQLALLAAIAACSSEDSDGNTPVGTGGAVNASGGTAGRQGGAPTGGTASPQPTGGVKSTGGSVNTGGAVTGGSPATGGAPTGGRADAGTGGMAGGGAAGGGGTAGAAGGGGTAGGGGNSAGAPAAGKGGGGAAGAAGSGGAGGAAGAGKSAGCGKTRTLMNGRRTIQSGGNREYILRVPDNYDNTRPYRLIVAYHWLNGNANNVANGGGSTEKPYYGLWDLAENSTIFVAPEGLDAGWANTGGRDLTLTDAILAQVQGDLCIDTTRIFATGFSYGAGMSYAVACARPTVFRGVALYAGAQLSGCTGGTTPIAYFAAHGISDSVLNISQGRTLRDRFVMLNGCTAQSPPEPARGSGTHTCTSYTGCAAATPLRWCAFDGDHNPTQKDQGKNDSWVPGEAWTFISQF